MTKRMLTMMLALLLALGMLAVPALADGDGTYSFPSTNELNREQQVPGRVGQPAPYVDLVTATPSSVTLQFVNPASGLAFFEHRIDGNPVTSGTAHPVVPGSFIYPGTAVTSGNTVTRTFEATEQVEIRLALGGERDWDFDWTPFEVADALTKEDCKKGGWRDLGFRNQGQCIASIVANPRAGK
jgi:hypothetical protein